MCGEQKKRNLSRSIVWGSPPRVRGTVVRALAAHQIPGITPACAGNSCRQRGSVQDFQDHPRVCGEQGNLPATFFSNAGSPPRVRGTVLFSVRRTSCYRITPACAGNSLISLPNQLATWDHPRVCGEQQTQTSSQTMGLGSPPRVRGTASSGISICPNIRITPACAGNRIFPWPIIPAPEDHPRVCGEQPPPARPSKG